MRKLKLTELGRLDPEEYKSKVKQPVVVVLDNLRSAMNVGSFFRTADAFAIEKIYLCGISARPPHKEITKTAIGATETVEWEYVDSIEKLIPVLKEKYYHIYGVEQTTHSIALQDVTPQYPAVLVFGNEVNGLTEEILPLLDACIEIPQYGTKHSFNVAVCGGIVLWEYLKILRELKN